MKKLALIPTAVLAAALAAPAAQAAPTQTMKVKLSSTKASKKNPTVVSVSLSTGTTGTLADGSKATITAAKITLPKGLALNYKAFPVCSDSTAQDCPSATKVGSGTAQADVDGVDYTAKGDLTAYIGSNANLLIRTQFSQPAVIDQVLPAKLGTSGGAYTFALAVPESLQQPLTDAYQQLKDFTLAFPKKTIKKNGKKVGLATLKTCPSGGYVFKGEFTYRDQSTATAEAKVPCKQSK